MKPFNLEEAKAGKPVCMRNGRSVRIICWDKAGDEYSIVALGPVPGSNAVDEALYCYTQDGVYLTGAGEQDYDLFMAITQKTVWVNLYRNSASQVYAGTCTCDTEVEAKEISNKGTCYVGTYPLTYEE